MKNTKTTVRRTRANKEAQSATPETLATQAEQTIASDETNLARLDATEVVNVKKEVGMQFDKKLRGLGSYYNEMCKGYKTSTLEYLIDIKRRGKNVNSKLVREIVNARNFNLFREFMTEAELKREAFKGSQVLGILERAVTKSDKQLIKMGKPEFCKEPVK